MSKFDTSNYDEQVLQLDHTWEKLNFTFQKKKTKIKEELDESSAMLRGCKLNSTMLINLINDLLDLATQENKSFKLNKKYFNL